MRTYGETDFLTVEATFADNVCIESRGVARNVLEGGSKSSEIFFVGHHGWSTKKILGCGMAKTVNFGPFSMIFHVL